jgi:predicted oxidoreductase
MHALTIRRAPRPFIDGVPPLSPLGWGMWRFKGDDLAAARALADAALEIGITLFDTADIYGADTPAGFGSAEALFGRVLAQVPDLRDRIILATKGGIIPGIPYISRADYLIRACEASLKRLNTDIIDLYQVHRPDLLAHPAEVAAALDTLRRDGKIRAAGVSNHTPAQVAALQAHLPFTLVSIQPEFSAAAPSPLFDGVMDQAMERDLAVLAWSPLGGGRLLGAGDDARLSATIAQLDRIAQAHGASRAAVAYAWVMAHPVAPVPLIGSQNPQRIRDAADAFAVTLTDADWYAVLQASMGAPLP